jgi:hypothetical protein
MESICRLQSCDLHQNRFPDHIPYCIVNSVFVVAVIVAVAAPDLSALHNHAAH